MAAHLTSYMHPPGSSDCAAVSAERAGQAAGARFEPPRRPADRRSAAAAVSPSPSSDGCGPPSESPGRLPPLAA